MQLAEAAAVAVLVVASVRATDLGDNLIDKSQFEAAFQGRCGHGSACEQLCYELHDGMYECDCRPGFDLNKDGYSCNAIFISMLGLYVSGDIFTDCINRKCTQPCDSHICAQLNFNNGTVLTPSCVYSDACFEARVECINNANNAERNGTFSLHFSDDSSEDILYQKDASFSAELAYPSSNSSNYNLSLDAPSMSTSPPVTSLSPNLEQKLPIGGLVPRATEPLSVTPSTCGRECGPGGSCAVDEVEVEYCECPLGRGGDYCEKDVEIRSPRFTGRSWLAFPALRAAYKHVQVTLELRPEAYDGIFLLTGERDDMAGDFMALLLHQGFVEFRFDCGSGVGVVRSEETVILNQWNHITLYRHRWDAWLQLNGGKHVQGRSKGLFSRITFREPLFIGGAGNTTGLSEKLPVAGGLKGCVRHLEVNDQVYRFSLEPQGDAAKGFGIQECTADRCSRVPCQHGGKCLTSQDSAVCLCPLGFSGDLCETRVDLEVPAFNGSSHLRYRGLADSALTWLDIEVTLKPNAANGMLLYNGHRTDGSGDFMALYLNEKHVEFAFDLGTGTGIVRSDHEVSLGEWHQVKISRTGRLAIMQVDSQLSTEVLSPGAFTQLSLPQNLYLGGVPNFSSVSPKIKIRTSFVGCVQKVIINGNQLSILAEALGGVNVDNCPHPCVARPCGDDGTCIPDMDYFTCQCKPGYRDQLCSQKSPTEMTSIETPIPSFSGKDSYLHFSDSKTIKRLNTYPLDVNMRFKMTSSDGLLLWFGLPEGGNGKDFLAIGVERGSLVLRYNLGSEEMVIVYNVTRVNDNLWHRVKAIRNSVGGLLVVDDGPAVTTQSIAPLKPHSGDRGLYVGGMPQADAATGHRYASGIIGCVADLVLNTDYRIQLITMSAVGRNVGHCEP